MSNHEPLADRVAQRYQAVALLRNVPATSVDALFSDSEIASRRDIARLLECRLDALRKVQFRASRSDRPNTVAWEALDKHGEIVAGQVLVHAGVRDDQVFAWAEVVISNDHTAGRIGATGTPEERLLRARLERIAQIARRLVDDARVQPQKPSVALVEDLLRIADQADYVT